MQAHQGWKNHSRWCRCIRFKNLFRLMQVHQVWKTIKGDASAPIRFGNSSRVMQVYQVKEKTFRVMQVYQGWKIIQSDAGASIFKNHQGLYRLWQLSMVMQMHQVCKIPMQKFWYSQQIIHNKRFSIYLTALVLKIYLCLGRRVVCSLTWNTRARILKRLVSFSGYMTIDGLKRMKQTRKATILFVVHWDTLI